MILGVLYRMNKLIRWDTTTTIALSRMVTTLSSRNIVSTILVCLKADVALACERRRISGCRFGGEKRRPEIRLRSQANVAPFYAFCVSLCNLKLN